mgnify:CR=1 FL=1
MFTHGIINYVINIFLNILKIKFCLEDLKLNKRRCGRKVFKRDKADVGTPIFER